MIRTPLPQLVPSEICFRCEVCCRFPEADSGLRPYFTETEIRQAVDAGVSPGRFSDHRGCQVSVVPNPSGEGYVCPAFDVATSHCRIYDVRPLDCQIYPLAVMWNADRSKVVLGWDTKCPFAQEREAISHQPSAISSGQVIAPAIEAYADRIAAQIERDDTVVTYARHPRLVGPFQDDVIVLRPLPKLSERLRPPAISHQPSAISLRRLTLADRERFDRVCAAQDTPLAAYAFVYHVIWAHLFTYVWTEVDDHLCLFAEYPDGLFMPLPPLPLSGKPSVDGSGFEVRGSNDQHVGPRTPYLVPEIVASCFQLMRARNRGSTVSRIENIPEEWKPGYEACGYRLTPKSPDYLYATAALARLAGDRYKSQRAACNRFERDPGHSYAPYRATDLDACIELSLEWVRQQETQGPARSDPVARAMLEDVLPAHRAALAQAKDLGVLARVVRVGGAIRAYTLGYPRSPAVYCVLHEVADRTVPGLAQFLFREFCRELEGLGYAWVNTMDDSGLPSLAHSKRTYHPARLVASYIATEN